MNTEMYLNSFTTEHIKKLQDIKNVQVIPPISKKLAYGEIGVGEIADTETIYNTVKQFHLT